LVAPAPAAPVRRALVEQVHEAPEEPVRRGAVAQGREVEEQVVEQEVVVVAEVAGEAEQAAVALKSLQMR
jgi:hypothetical protein